MRSRACPGGRSKCVAAMKEVRSTGLRHVCMMLIPKASSSYVQRNICQKLPAQARFVALARNLVQIRHLVDVLQTGIACMHRLMHGCRKLSPCVRRINCRYRLASVWQDLRVLQHPVLQPLPNLPRSAAKLISYYNNVLHKGISK